MIVLQLVTSKYDVHITCTSTNLHIVNSYKIKSRKQMVEIIQGVIDIIKPSKINEYAVFKRTINSMVNEWCTHNILYELGIFKERTASVDLNYPLKWYWRLMYNIIGKFYA